MKKQLLAAIVALAASGAAFGAAPVKHAPAAVNSTELLAANPVQEVPYFVVGYYDESMVTPNYYVILSTDPNARYNKNTGDVTLGTGYLLTLDLYNIASSPVALPAGRYLPGSAENGTGAGTYSTEYSMATYYENGQALGSFMLSEPIDIKVKDGVYDVTTTIKYKEDAVDFHFSGRMPIQNYNEKQSAYAQIKRDIEVNMKGGVAFYQGVTDYSLNGVTYINLYSAGFDEATGAMTQNGFNLAMMVAHKRVIRKDDFKIFPGTYTNAMNLARDTWYPCREVNYMFDNQIITTQFGSFIREYDMKSSDRFTYGYLAEGTFTIEDAGDGVYKGRLEAVTDLGFKVTVNFEGKIALNTENAQFPATLSSLTDDVALDFSKLETGRVFHRDIVGGCRDFTVDLGSPAGRDEGINYGGDLIRLEFLAPQSHARLRPGLYTVSERHWNSYELSIGAQYEPMSLNQFHWGGSSGSDIDGTRYAHFKDGAYCVYDVWAPVIEGTVRVETDDYKNYIFDIDLMDDAGFKITGHWDGPIEYMYDADALQSGVQEIASDNAEINVIFENGLMTVIGCDPQEVTLFNINGKTVAKGMSSDAIDVTPMPHGIYLLKANNTTIKVAL